MKLRPHAERLEALGGEGLDKEGKRHKAFVLSGRWLHESQHRERLPSRQALGMPVSQHEPLAACRVNEHPGFDKVKQ